MCWFVLVLVRFGSSTVLPVNLWRLSSAPSFRLGWRPRDQNPTQILERAPRSRTQHCVTVSSDDALQWQMVLIFRNSCLSLDGNLPKVQNL